MRGAAVVMLIAIRSSSSRKRGRATVILQGSDEGDDKWHDIYRLGTRISSPGQMKCEHININRNTQNRKMLFVEVE